VPQRDALPLSYFGLQKYITNFFKILQEFILLAFSSIMLSEVIMNKLTKIALVNSVATMAYVSLVVLVMSNGEKLFGSGDNFGIGLTMLMLFVLSASVTGSLVVGKPILLYLDGDKKDAVKLLLYTILDLFILTLIVMLSLFLIK